MTTPRGSRPDQAGVPYICATMDLAGSLAVVTGATEGIGRATAQALGRAGSRVAICARTEANVHATVRDLKAEGIDCIGMPRGGVRPPPPGAGGGDAPRRAP